MNKILYAFLSVLALTSCSKSFTIQGSSNVSTLDGHMLYLKVVSDTTMKNVDSCEVVHGQFHFKGSVDSVCMGTIFMDQDYVLPVVLEDGDITIKLDNTQQDVSGTPLNDSLTTFRNKLMQLQNQVQEMVNAEYQGYATGSNMDEVYAKLNARQMQLNEKIDKLMSGFVVENFDNVLGPWAFSLHTSSYEYPMLDPWIEDIMSKATDKFKNDPYVKDYYAKAQENQQIMNGTKMPASPAVPPQNLGQPMAAPTPNELAKPKQE